MRELTPRACYRKAFLNGFWMGVHLVVAVYPQQIADWWGISTRTISMVSWVGVFIGAFLWVFVPDSWYEDWTKSPKVPRPHRTSRPQPPTSLERPRGSMDWEGEEMTLPKDSMCYAPPPHVRWEPVESEGAVVAFTMRPCYRKGSHNHFVCEERYAREYTEGSKWVPMAYKDL